MSKYFGIWQTIVEMQSDFGGSYERVAQWVNRGEIPPSQDFQTAQVIARRGFTTTWKDLAAWHEAHKRRRQAVRLGQDAPPMPNVPFFPAVTVATQDEHLGQGLRVASSRADRG